MKQLLRTVAVLISLLSFAFANIVPIEHNENEDYLVECGNYSASRAFGNYIVFRKDLISSPTLRCLTIYSRNSTYVENGAFDEIPNLQYLNLQGNSISPNHLFSFGNLASVRKLILSEQRCFQCGRSNTIVHGIYPQLRYLDLKNNSINHIYSPWENPFPELMYLDISKNRLETFTFMHSRAEKLTHLYLSDNQISRFSLGPSALKWLVLDNNYIQLIGSKGVDLDGLTSLKKLSLANNRIASIRDKAFRDTVSLRHLNISGNLLSTIHPETFRNLQSLQVLILDQNSLEEVPIAVPLNITTLSMNCNRIKFLTINSLYNLPQLKTLSLSGNRILTVHPDAFQNKKMLEKLYLNNNELSQLPNNWCRSMKNLLYLDWTCQGTNLLCSNR